MEEKRKLGQFYTKNYEYILQKMYVPESTKILIEPFCGEGDLVKFAKKNQFVLELECYDIQPKYEYIIQRDTLQNPPDFKGKFILTNPPYLARNKCGEKRNFDTYQENDLYKCFIKIICETNNICDGGILIVPLNFFCSIRKQDTLLKEKFIRNYEIMHLNIFEFPVFDDTSYAVCAFQFQKRVNLLKTDFSCDLFKKENVVCSKIFNLNESNNYTIGGHMYHLPKSKDYYITRLTSKNEKEYKSSNIFVNCLDDKSGVNKIKFEYLPEKKYIDDTEKLSCRAFCTLIIFPYVEESKQILLVEKCNEFLNGEREKYESLFLTNYREGSRKRISFDLIYSIVGYILLSLN